MDFLIFPIIILIICAIIAPPVYWCHKKEQRVDRIIERYHSAEKALNTLTQEYLEHPTVASYDRKQSVLSVARDKVLERIESEYDDRIDESFKFKEWCKSRLDRIDSLDAKFDLEGADLADAFENAINSDPHLKSLRGAREKMKEEYEEAQKAYHKHFYG